ncbi:MAG TPA: YceI family protein [Bdellovibrionales bacterium]|nr:YceI family protein [Bdellovibrionales bacterium]
MPSKWLLAFAFLGAAPAAASTPAVLEGGSHCVAYQAEKVVFFLSKSKVIGKNCDIAAQVLPEVGGLYHIEVNVPVRSFNSGDPDRDKDVLKFLKADARPELTFRSKALSANQWRELFGKNDFPLEGELFIGEKSYPITIQSHYKEKDEMAEVSGSAKVRLEDFGISPPAVAGGVVVKAKPDIELHFNLLSARILGADSIRLGKGATP